MWLVNTLNMSSSARQNDMNACVVLPGTHSSARHMLLNSWHLLLPIASLSFVRFICWNFITKQDFVLKSHILQIYSQITMVMGFLHNGRFIIYFLLPGTSKASTLSVFLLGAQVHVLLLGTQCRGGSRISFGGGGGTKDYVCAPTPRSEVPYGRGPGPAWKLSVFVVDALSCYLSLILKHSDTEWDKKHIWSNFVWGGGGGGGGGERLLRPPLNPPLISWVDVNTFSPEPRTKVVCSISSVFCREKIICHFC